MKLGVKETFVYSTMESELRKQILQGVLRYGVLREGNSRRGPAGALRVGLNHRWLPGPAWWAVGAVPTEGPRWECDSSCLGPWVLGESDSVSPSAVSDSAAP